MRDINGQVHRINLFYFFYLLESKRNNILKMQFKIKINKSMFRARRQRKALTDVVIIIPIVRQRLISPYY